MSKSPHSLLPRIKVIPETVDKLKEDFDVSVTTIYKALNFASNSDQAIQIRKRAISLQDEVQKSNRKLVKTYDHEIN